MARGRRGFPRRKKSGRPEVGGSRLRLRTASVVMVTLLALTTVKLVHVQAFEASALSEQAEQQRVSKQDVPAERGTISDRHGAVLAFSGESQQLYANPQQLTETLREERAKDPSSPTPKQYKDEIARFVAKVTGGRIPAKEVRTALFSDDQFTYFGTPIDSGQARKITEEYPQIGSEYRASREYPAGSVAGDIIGGANWRMDERKIRGLIGLEMSLDDELAGKNGVQIADTARGTSDVVIPGTQELEPAVPGSDFRLTIDADLQFMVQRKLADYARRVQAESGSAVVLDAKTGQVRALANDRTFDPSSNDWGGDGLGNPAVSSPFEPGSVNKVITAAAAIENGIVRPNQVLQVPGKIKVADRTIGDAWQHGTIPLTFTGVLGKSSNVGTLQVAQELGPERFNEIAEKFGLGQSTGIELPGESAGTYPDREDWSGTTFANLPIGQGLSMTALQMASMYQAIANDGVRVPPRIIRSEEKPDGTTVRHQPPEGVRVVSPRTASTVRDMLRAVVQSPNEVQEGTGSDAALPGYQVAGKTGTAQQVDPECGCYSQSKHWITFAGMLPADNPRYVIGIMLDNPRAGGHASTTAAPLFHDIGAYLVQRHHLPLSPPAPEQKLRADKPL
ncbi:peptidoglycan D,D-transpeptidase FtsI family protein [Salinifilum ghardaiensis]